MQPIPMMATGTGGEGADEFKSLPFRASLREAGVAGGSRAAVLGDEGVMLGEDHSVLNLVDFQGSSRGTPGGRCTPCMLAIRARVRTAAP